MGLSGTRDSTNLLNEQGTDEYREVLGCPEKAYFRALIISWFQVRVLNGPPQQQGLAGIRR
jgi:hypothetical protein